jgi:hypothetical protein
MVLTSVLLSIEVLGDSVNAVYFVLRITLIYVKCGGVLVCAGML